MDIPVRARRVVAGTLNVPEAEIDLDTSLTIDLGADSLAMMQLLIALEDEFDVQIDDDEMMDARVFADVIRALEAKSLTARV